MHIRKRKGYCVTFEEHIEAYGKQRDAHETWHFENRKWHNTLGNSYDIFKKGHFFVVQNISRKICKDGQQFKLQIGWFEKLLLKINFKNCLLGFC